ncbi:hypothetical protein CVT25_006149 [Psilocybe cyanescens]|uniref:Aminoglycoside phosphotransferase domain-containing protein n=1 Tax=Psilocybe cyanescens TaxID=93625 RepID=A0A409WYZ4_PSICY|nr:hypothetical protein CVT25_006149 [Psilocybe cyanescens]
MIQYRNLVHDSYWEHRKAFHIVGTRQDALEPDSEYVKYPGKLATLLTLYTSVACKFVGTLSGNGIEELCGSIVDQMDPIEPTIGSRLQKSFERMQLWALDVIAFTFSLRVPPDINNDTPDSDDLPMIPDDNIAWEMIKTPEAVAYNKRLAAGAGSIISDCAPTFKIAPTLILKRLDPFERFNNIFVRAHTTIPVPQPRYLHLKEVFITDFIHGSMLLDRWDTLSAFYQFRIACTLRRYVSQMRRIISDRPGNIERGHVKGYLFDPHMWNGPFRDVETFRNWIAHTAYTGWIVSDEGFRIRNPGLTPPPAELNFPPNCDWTPVLTHCDISLSNVMLSDDGVLWIVDWADSGFYPRWLESMGMRRYEGAPESWKRWFSFISEKSKPSNFGNMKEPPLSIPQNSCKKFWKLVEINTETFHEAANTNVEMPTDIRVSILGGPGSGRTTLCQRLNDYVYLRVSDNRHFRFKTQEAEMNSLGLLNESDSILLTFGLDKDCGDLVVQYQKLVHDSYWERRKVFHMVGTKHDTLDPELEFVSTLSGSGIEELCGSIVDQAHHITPTIGSRIHNTFGRVRSWVLDVIAFTFSLPVPLDVNKHMPDSDDLPMIPDDNTAWETIKAPEAVAYNKRLAAVANSIFDCAPTFRIEPTLILKRLDPCERFNNIFVRSHTNIPVPQPRYLHLKEAFITDFIPGSMLLECWDSLSAFYQFRIACTLRRYVSQMRHITNDRPGNIERGLVKGYLFDPDFWNGPFRDVEAFRHWITHIVNHAWIASAETFPMDNPGLTPPTPQLDFPPNCDWTPVLAHCDLSLSNVMLSDDGVLWIIDWADSGFYPPWLESMGMRRYEKAP